MSRIIVSVGMLAALAFALPTGSTAPPEPKHHEGIDACARACAHCMLECESCARHCADMIVKGEKKHEKTLGTCADCGDLCAVAGKIVARKGPFMVTACEACAKACEDCGKACAEFASDEHMQKCAKACRDCAKACRDMIKHAGHERREAAK
jgi:hypothetical protein